MHGHLNVKYSLNIWFLSHEKKNTHTAHPLQRPTCELRVEKWSLFSVVVVRNTQIRDLRNS